MPEIATLGDDTFWTWALREFPESTFSPPTNVTKNDVILRYSVKNYQAYPEHTIGLMWELYPEMKVMLNSNAWDDRIAMIDQCGYSCARVSTASELMVPYYTKYNKPVDILPLAVDTDLFKPYDKAAMRAKWNIPQDKVVGFWCGSLHAMKGFDRLQEYATQHPEIFWIIVWRWPQEPGHLVGALNLVFMPQQELAELMSCANFALCCGRLRPFFMVDWEAMACNLPLVILGGLEKDFVPSTNPRDDVFRLGWDRRTARNIWINYINSFIRSKQ